MPLHNDKKLLSVSQLTKDQSCIFEFSDSGFLIKDRHSGRILATGSMKGNLYALDGRLVTALAALRSGKAPALDDVWHQRLGHPHSRFLRVLSSNNSIDVSSWTKNI